jgi:hypothetical protein
MSYLEMALRIARTKGSDPASQGDSRQGATSGRLDTDPWPPECLKMERLFAQEHARLFPLLAKRVWTPQGAGILLSTFADQCEIQPDGANRTVRVRTEDVKPIQ